MSCSKEDEQAQITLKTDIHQICDFLKFELSKLTLMSEVNCHTPDILQDLLEQ